MRIRPVPNFLGTPDKLNRRAEDGAGRFRFGDFELDLRNRELRRNGARVKLQEQPLQLLTLLIERPGTLVKREELAQHLWPGLHVNFDRSSNTAVNALRQALADSPRNPRFIETRAGLGYSFIASVEAVPHEKALSEAYLKGRYFYDKLREDDLHKSVAHFQAALAEDPRSALAHAALADSYVQFALLGVIPAPEAHARAREYATKAVQIDGELGVAHASLGGVKKVFERDWDGAQTDYRRALDLEPNCASAHSCYGDLLSATGKHAQAIQELRRAQALDPLSLVIQMELAWVLYLAQDFEAAMEQCWKTLAMEPKFALAQHTLGLAYEQMGMHDEAIVELRNARVCSEDHPAMLTALGHAYAIAGDRRAAETVLDELEQIARYRHVSAYGMSLVYVGLGDFNGAVKWLEKAYAERDVWLLWVNVEPGSPVCGRMPGLSA